MTWCRRKELAQIFQLPVAFPKIDVSLPKQTTDTVAFECDESVEIWQQRNNSGVALQLLQQLEPHQAGLVGISWGLLDLGGLLETRAWAYRSEVVRVAIVPLLPLGLLTGLAAWAWAVVLGFGILAFLFWMSGLRRFFLNPSRAGSEPEEVAK